MVPGMGLVPDLASDRDSDVRPRTSTFSMVHVSLYFICLCVMV